MYVFMIITCLVTIIPSNLSRSPQFRTLLPSGTESMDLIVVSRSFSNFRERLLNRKYMEHNVAVWQNLYPIEESKPVLLFVIPESLKEFVDNLNQIGQLLALDENSVSEVWDPIIFVLWPINEINETAFSNNKEVEVYLRHHVSQVIRLDSDVFVMFPSRDSPLSPAPTPSSAAETAESFSLCEIFTSFDKILQLRQIPADHAHHAFESYLRKSARRRNMEGVALKVVGLADEDFIHQVNLQRTVNGSVVFVSGLGVELLLALQYIMNFSYIGVEGEGWVEKLENGSWVGMARQIRAGEADLSISQSTHLSYRLEGLSFLHPTTTGQILVFFRQPPASSMHDIFLAPFKLEVWASLCLFWLLFTACTIALYRFQIKFGGTPSESDECAQGEKFFWCLRVFCQKGASICPSTISLRIVFIFSEFVGVVYYVAYSASLVSNLAVVEVPIKTIDDLSHSDLVILGDFWLPNKREVVKSIEEGYPRPSSLTLPDDERYLMIDKAMPKLLKSPAAFATFADGFMTVFYRFNHTDKFYCDTFSSLNPMKAPTSSGMFVQRGSPLKELINPRILMIAERGIAVRLNKHYKLHTSAQCTEKRTKLGQGIQVSDIFTIYFLIGGGFLLSFVASVLENIAFHFSKRRHDLGESKSSNE